MQQARPALAPQPQQHVGMMVMVVVVVRVVMMKLRVRVRRGQHRRGGRWRRGRRHGGGGPLRAADRRRRHRFARRLRLDHTQLRLGTFEFDRFLLQLKGIEKKEIVKLRSWATSCFSYLKP